MRNATRSPSIISDHRLARLLTLVWLRALRMAGCLLVGEAPHRDDLRAASRFVRSFILIRVARSIRAPQPATSAPRACARPGFRQRALPTSFALLRAAVGARLRRQLCGRDALAHLSALIRAILNLNRLIAQLARRLRRRLTRLRPVLLTHAFADALGGAQPATLLAHDSS